ncbi:MAG: homoaconitate hydratase family protein [Gammaproteobacteria bacterium]|nr:homoaconitate hydratase family protein [Gammaproteobacteria bacterium]NIM71655.1 homoaconitate hydratase family protein [Gammaproteobacteria bacterium]NIO23399.1 homoaconitate hydratase family protein [Gammaproteobacteria bacterium]NIO64020.1 homoaconitate hydratase family protein [Gammaproteobacteria bacterium]NIP46129.1 3-isopropylmalate dehydratase large subunit [Gammaproteobacteria bacterium]
MPGKHNDNDAARQTPMSMTLAEKIIARASGRERVRPGEIVTCEVDLAMMHDSSGPRRQIPKLAELGVDVWDAAKVVLITDHFVGERDELSIEIQSLTRDWAAKRNLGGYHEAQGICHVVLPERGHLAPGMFVVGGDSHSTTGGAFGCFMTGIGATDMAGVLATGSIWVRVPQTLRVRVDGVLGDGVAAKDVILAICHRIGINGANYMTAEYTGSGVAAMVMDERMVLANMAVELGAKCGIVAPDDVTCAWLAGVGVDVADAQTWQSDDDAPVAREIVVDAAELAPQVAAPHSPENSAPVNAHAGTPIDQAYIGACTGAKLDDLRMAARIVDGRRIAEGVRFFVAPASVRINEEAEREGVLDTLRAAGAAILPSACGACIGLGPARLGAGEVGISSSSRNFQGRMGDASSQTYLSSPYTVAATALAGHIADPRDYL